MNILDRFILTIYTFCLAVISLFVMAVSLNLVSYGLLSTYFVMIFKNNYYSKIALGVAILFFLVSIRFLLSGISKSKGKAPIYKSSQLGGILISLESIQNIIASELKNIDGIADIKIELQNKKGTVGIKLRVTVTPERNIPEFSTTIQTRTKSVVEKIAGVDVSYVEVLVLDVVQTIKHVSKSKVV